MNAKRQKRVKVADWPAGTVQESAYRLKISDTTFRTWRRIGSVPLTRTGRRVLAELKKGGRR